MAETHGITLSSAQHLYCVRRRIPGLTVSLCDYRDYVPSTCFDAAMCICMMEHIATPEDARAGRHIAMYRDFFSQGPRLDEPRCLLRAATITTNLVPRSRTDLDDMRHANNVIFPGGLCPRVEDLIAALSPYFELEELYSRRLHYRRTAAVWLERLRRNEALIVARWGGKVYQDYLRYLSFCVRAFDKNYQSLHQFKLRRATLG